MDDAAWEALALRVGVMPRYLDDQGREVTVAHDDLLATLELWGIDVRHGPATATARHEEVAAARVMEPVVVAWDGHLPDVPMRFPGGRPAEVWLETADGNRLDPPAAWSAPLSLGEHRLVAEGADWRAESVVLSAPTTAWTPAPGRERRWGLFLPLYALRTARTRGIADIGDLRQLFDWLDRHDGDAVVSLPLLAAHLDPPGEFSPYSPVSRRAWNELYADLDDLPGPDGPRAGGPAAGSGGSGTSAAPPLDHWSGGDVAAPGGPGPATLPTAGEDRLLDYPAIWRWKRAQLAAAAERFYAEGGAQHDDFRRFVDEFPIATRYARFRAVGERHGRDWRTWPEALRRPGAAGSELPAAEGAPGVERFHLYVQWAMERQLAALGDRVDRRGQMLAFDLPIGAHHDGFDVWDNQDAFVTGASVGAPADTFFPLGQDWGFPPLHPERSRHNGHRYFRQCLEHHLRHAGLLRIDHVMGLRRLFWLRTGEVAARGAYVTYPQEELFACLTMAAARRGAMVVGENLGTVPVEVNEALDRHRVLGTYVLQFAWDDLLVDRFRAPGPHEIATFGSHDMATFAAVWSGRDLTDRRALGLLDDERLADRRRQRAAVRPVVRRWLGVADEQPPDDGAPDDGAPVLREVTRALAESESPLVVLNVEDFWLELRPQNVPGTTDERWPNWRLVAAHDLETWDDEPGVRDALDVLAATRPRPSSEPAEPTSPGSAT